MKKFLLLPIAALSLLAFTEKADAAEMYRLYNRNNSEHFYTADRYERKHLVELGWEYEGIGWVAPETGDPVYRLYNPNSGDHHYTLNQAEKDNLVKVGWHYENIGWYSSPEKQVPIYRAYNPNATTGSHNYTKNKNEQNNLVKNGWRDEQVGWYGISETIIEPNEQEKVDAAKFDQLSEKLQVLLIATTVDERAETPGLLGYVLGYNFNQGKLYLQVHSGAGSGHPIFKMTTQSMNIMANGGVAWMGAAYGYETVAIPEVATPKYSLYRQYLNSKKDYDSALEQVKINENLTAANFNNFVAQAK
ncbi:hypothetical protein M2139_001561 [Enterococcus sp. PF1-24]|uniref:hypothetical protein n=1 Tax=unclassified Enterococcus TaxID=2608891 RepID=UPI002474958C|nr:MULTISPECIES: hypothetical protein [unclassified Enterococcus]MDH6364574.1 hypothetical protein [Enterococcus sp. PFB1-1]MDH6401675.1 hypothetical protein [Enterococcus sp. PF1-24]